MSAFWRFAGASVIGTSHDHTGTECQDSHAARIFTQDGDEPVLVMAVSDGAGSATHSSTGSEIACSIVFECVELFLAEGRSIAAISEAEALAWVGQVKDELRRTADAAGHSVKDYACTLLVAIVGTTESAFVQIGDGAMVVADEQGDWCWVFWPSRGEFANTTFFVTDESAQSSISFSAGPRRVQEVALFTDGLEALLLHYGTKTVHAPFFNTMFVPVRASNQVGEDLGLSRELADYLASPVINDRTDDDKTLVLATRCPIAAPAP